MKTRGRLRRSFFCLNQISIGVLMRARTGSIGAVNYAASKAGLEGLTRSLGRELIRKGIFVNAIALGFFDVGIARAIEA